MWVPNRPQWTVIWLVFLAALWFFYWGSQRTPMFTRAEHLMLGVFVVIGTALLVLLLYWLESRKNGKARESRSQDPGSDPGKDLRRLH